LFKGASVSQPPTKAVCIVRKDAADDRLERRGQFRFARHPCAKHLLKAAIWRR
jgi:hypothetical protein